MQMYCGINFQEKIRNALNNFEGRNVKFKNLFIRTKANAHSKKIGTVS